MIAKSARFLILVCILVSSLVFSPVTEVHALSFPAQMNKSFTPISIVAGGTSILSVTIFNPNSFPLTVAHYHDFFPAGISLANPINLTITNCGTATVTDDSLNPLAPGGTMFRMDGGTVPPQVGATPGSCTVTVTVTSNTPGNLINTIPSNELTSNGDDGGTIVPITNTDPASATLQVGAVQPPSLSKGFVPNTMWVGQISVMTITIRNNDLTTALTQVSLTDTLPANVTVASAPVTPQCGGGTITSTAGSVTLTGGSIAPNSTCNIVVNVTSTTQGPYTNTIPAGPGGPGSIQTQQGVTNASAATANLNVQAIGILKTFAPATIVAGGTSTMTITLQNPTGSAYTGVNLTDTLPAGMTISGTPATPQCGGAITSTAGSVTLTGGTIPASLTPPLPLGTCIIMVTVTTPPNAPSATLTNTIHPIDMSTTQVITIPANVSANLTIVAGLTVAKAFNPTTITAGGTSTVTITLQNHTGAALTGVNFTDNLPANLTVSGTPVSPQCGGAITFTAGSVTLTGGTVPASPTPPNPAGTCTITYVVTSLVAGTYSNTIPAGDVTTTQGISNLTTATTNPNLTVVNPGGPVAVAKAFQPLSILPGAPSRLRITITAPSDTGVTGLSLSDTLPGDLHIVGTASVPPAPANPVTTCTGATLTAAIGSQLIQLTGGSIAAAGGNCTITVYVTSSTPGSYPNTIPANNVTTTEGRTNTNPSNTATLLVSSLTVTKAFFPTTVNANGQSTLTITLQNTTTSPLDIITLTDQLSTMGGVVPTSGVYIAAVPNQSTTCTGGVITFPDTRTILLTGGTIPAQVGAVPGICTISVDVQGRGGNAARTDTLPTANVRATVRSTGTVINPMAQATATLTIAPLSIGVVKGFDPLTVFGGSGSTLSVQLVNPNNVPLTGIAFTDAMPAGMIIANPSNLNVGTCGGALTGLPGAGSFSFSGGSLPSSGSCTLTLSATMTVNGNLTNTILAGAVTTFNGASNPQPASATLTNLPGASISKFFAPNPIYAGSYSLLTITIQNTGNIALTGMGLVDNLPGVLPAGLAVAGGAAPAPVDNCGGTLTANPGSQIIQLVGGSLAGSSSCTLVVAVTSTVAGNYLNTIPTGSLTNLEGATNQLPAADTLVVQALAALGDFVWHDLNANGIQDAGEAGIPNVTVNLLDAAGTTILDATTTDASGLYHFTNLMPGTYRVGFVPPAGYSSSPADQGADDAVDSDANTATGITTSSYTLVSGDDNLTVDAGLYQPAALGDFVWNDVNANGIQDAGEAGIPNVTVNLLDATGTTTLATTTTDASGLYHFTNLTPGSYRVGFVPPAGYAISPADQGANDTIDSDANTVTGITTASYTLVSGDNNLTIDAGLYQPAALGDFVWNDVNANGIQDAGEAGIPNVTVNLLDATGTTILDTTTTDASGLYHFTNLTPGTYRVGFVNPGGYTFSPADQGANDAVDSDANTATGITTGSYTLAPGDNNLTVDAGLYQPAALGDFVWNDVNANGIQDAGETGIPNVTVNLLDAAGTTILATTTTDASGLYHFTNLTPGTYRVGFVSPAGYTLSTANQGANDAVDSDANTVTGITGPYTLASGDNNLTVDAGLSQSAALGDFVWHDLNADGIQDAGEAGIPNVTVHLLDAAGTTILATTTTDASGLYSFTDLTPGTYRVGFVPPAGYSSSPADQGANDAIDSDANTATGLTGPYTLAPGDNNLTVDAGLYQPAALGDFVWHDLNANGIQDAGEAGIPNVTVNLLDAAGTTILATTTTDASGLYHFTNLLPGTYRVGFVAPVGYTLSPPDQGANDAVDSDANTATGITTGNYTLAPGDNNLTVDAGLYQPAALGDFVWNDANANGIQDAGEAGIPNVTVNLLDATGTTTLATTTTDANGLYHFTNLAPGTYRVGFVAPAGYVFSFADQGVNDAIDSDANTATGITSSSYTLAPGDNNLTVDAGLYQPAAGLFDPPTGFKVLNAQQLPELEWRMVWINNTNTAAINVQIADPIPAGTTYVLNSLTCVANNASVTVSCLYDSVLNRIFWQGHIAPDFGVTDPANALNSVVITFRITVPDTVSQVNNQGSSLTDTDGDGSFANETTPASVTVSNIATWSRGTSTNTNDNREALTFTALPKTGFAPGVMTVLPLQPPEAAYNAEGDIWLEVPRLGLHMSIVGVPFSNGNWDVTWISNQAGWLQGTAFPTHAGNSVLTGHIYKADGTPGPFINLHTLQFGDRIIVHLDGQSYIYEVRDDKVISPDDSSAIKHEIYPWLTVITCKDFNAATNTYAHRVAVRAVLIKIENDAPPSSTGNRR